MSAGFRGIAFQDLLELLHGVQWVTGLFEGERKVVAGIDGFGLQGESDFVGGEGLFPAAKVVGSEAEIIVGIEVGGIRVDCLLVIAEGLIDWWDFCAAIPRAKWRSASRRLPALGSWGEV